MIFRLIYSIKHHIYFIVFHFRYIFGILYWLVTYYIFFKNFTQWSLEDHRGRNMMGKYVRTRTPFFKSQSFLIVFLNLQFLNIFLIIILCIFFFFSFLVLKFFNFPLLFFISFYLFRFIYRSLSLYGFIFWVTHTTLYVTQFNNFLLYQWNYCLLFFFSSF